VERIAGGGDGGRVTLRALSPTLPQDAGRAEVRFRRAVPARIACRGLADQIAWRPESLDLVDLATAVLIADRSVRRVGAQPRRISVLIPVRHPRLWRDIASDIAKLLHVLTDDRFELEFCSAPRKPSSKRLGRPPRLDRVALFSGGLDSAAAAAVFAEGDEITGFVSHYVTGIQRINRLLQQIGIAYGRRRPVIHAGFFISPGRGVALREHSRRTRSFLFASLATVTAVETGASEIAVCENGPLALNLPLSAAMVPTRHAHSAFLDAVAGLARRAFGAEIRVVNPFELRTKGEVSRVFTPNPALALQTTSCWHQQWSGRGARYGHGHCGLCLPCLVRRVALTAAEIAFPPRHFDVDVVRLAHKARKTAADSVSLGPFRALSRFADEIQHCPTWRRFLEQFPEAIESHSTMAPLSPDEWWPALFGMMRRFGTEVTTALSGPVPRVGS